MPPKRKLKTEVEELSSSEGSASPLLNFEGLTSDQVLSLIVGVATRLSARVAALTHSAAFGDAQVYRDSIRVTHCALSHIGPAILDLMELETVLQRIRS